MRGVVPGTANPVRFGVVEWNELTLVALKVAADLIAAGVFVEIGTWFYAHDCASDCVERAGKLVS